MHGVPEVSREMKVVQPHQDDFGIRCEPGVQLGESGQELVLKNHRGGHLGELVNTDILEAEENDNQSRFGVGGRKVVPAHLPGEAFHLVIGHGKVHPLAMCASIPLVKLEQQARLDLGSGKKGQPREVVKRGGARAHARREVAPDAADIHVETGGHGVTEDQQVPVISERTAEQIFVQYAFGGVGAGDAVAVVVAFPVVTFEKRVNGTVGVIAILAAEGRRFKIGKRAEAVAVEIVGGVLFDEIREGVVGAKELLQHGHRHQVRHRPGVGRRRFAAGIPHKNRCRFDGIDRELKQVPQVARRLRPATETAGLEPVLKDETLCRHLCHEPEKWRQKEEMQPASFHDHPRFRYDECISCLSEHHRTSSPRWVLQ